MEEIRILGIAPFESIRAAMERVAREEFPAVRFEAYTGDLEEGVKIAQLLFLEDDNEWLNGGTYPWEAIGLTALDDKGEGVVVIGREGEVVIWTPSGIIQERIRVLERIVTDRGVETDAQIEALRDRDRIGTENDA